MELKRTIEDKHAQCTTHSTKKHIEHPVLMKIPFPRSSRYKSLGTLPFRSRSQQTQILTHRTRGVSFLPAGKLKLPRIEPSSKLEYLCSAGPAVATVELSVVSIPNERGDTQSSPNPNPFNFGRY